ncbi:MAG TPA: hypothetical protein PLF03_05770 [Candidatus Omnitrophota bacterium]|nr:hypothetical protein [Candidatus Omnitrophota bacterium]
MSKVVSTNKDQAVTSRGWEALEIKLKIRGLSCAEIQEAHKSFDEGIELLSRMFLNCYDLEKKPLV